MYDRILVPTDGSDVARAAAEVGVELASRFGAELHGIHVPGPTEELPDTDGPPGPSSRGERALEEVAELARAADLAVTTVVVDPDDAIHPSIVSYAEDHGVDCIVMGTYGRRGVDRFVLGSVAERTVRESPVPVVTVHEETTLAPEIESVLVPTDGSECATAAARHAVELAIATGATLHVVHVVDVGIVWGEYDSGVVLTNLEEAGRAALDEVIEMAEREGVSAVESSVLTGTPHSSIVDYAEERDVDCVVMGTHGRTGLQRYLLGSVTERVVRLCDRPVFTVGGGDSGD